MKKLMSKLHFRSIYKTIVLTLVLCFLYNIAYLLMSASVMNVYIRQSLEVVLSLLSSLGFLLHLYKDLEGKRTFRLLQF